MARTHRTAASTGLSTLLIALGILFASPQHAQAQPEECYPIDSADCPADASVSDTVVAQGETVSATATGLDPGTTASGVVRSEPLHAGTKTVGADGTATFSVRIPDDFETGRHRFVIRGVADGTAVTLVATFTVVADEAGDDAGAGGLPATGSDDSMLSMAGLGVALLAAGGVAVYAGRRRQAQPA